MRSVRDEVREVPKDTFAVAPGVWVRADDAALGAAIDRVWWPVWNKVKDNA